MISSLFMRVLEIFFLKVRYFVFCRKYKSMAKKAPVLESNYVVCTLSDSVTGYEVKNERDVWLPDELEYVNALMLKNKNMWLFFMKEGEELYYPFQDSRSFDDLVGYLNSLRLRTFQCSQLSVHNSVDHVKCFIPDQYDLNERLMVTKSGMDDLDCIVGIKTENYTLFKELRRSVYLDEYNHERGYNHTIGALVTEMTGVESELNNRYVVEATIQRLEQFNLINRGEW